MENNKLIAKMISKTVELYRLAEEDKMLYGDSYVEFKKRSIEIINPKNVVCIYKKEKGALKTLKDFNVECENQVAQSVLVERHYDLKQEAIRDIEEILSFDKTEEDKLWEKITGNKIVYSEEAKQGVVNYIKWKFNVTEEDLI